LNTKTRIGSRSATAVAISNAFIEKQPSPQIAATKRSGRASWTPIAAPIDGPIDPRPVITRN
jgi:hypothetical protein